MKKIFSLLALLLCAVVGTAEANAGSFETGKLTGTIGKYKVVMSLNFNESNHTVTGWYYYKSKGPKNKIRLSGTYRTKSLYDGSLHINMREFVDGKMTGTFNVDFNQHSDMQGAGMWISGIFTTTAGKRFDVIVERTVSY